MTGLDLARSGKLSDLMLISQRLKKSIGSCAQQYGHWSEQNRIIRDENAFSSCLDCIAILLLPVPHCVREFFYSFTPMKGAYLLPWWQSNSQIVATPRNYPMSLLSWLTIKICVCATYFIRTCKDRTYHVEYVKHARVLLYWEREYLQAKLPLNTSVSSVVEI